MSPNFTGNFCQFVGLFINLPLKKNCKMKKLLIIYISLILLFLVETVIFLLAYADIYGAYGVGEWLSIFAHSLPHDVTMASYVIALPLMLHLVYIWVPGRWYRRFIYGFIGFVSALLFIAWSIDLILFGYWGFRLDATPLIYLKDNPVEALSQVQWWWYLVFVIIVAAFVWCVEKGLHFLSFPSIPSLLPFRRRVAHSLVWLVMAALCFVGIRGGVTESTMNIGRAYFSSEQMLNQAAVNPAFSFFYSVSKREDYAKMYRFMSPEVCDEALLQLHTATRLSEAEPLQLLRTQRPNIVLLILEGFSGKALTALYPDADPRVMPCLSQLYDEGIGWDRFYAHSWRTDRGVASILASYPAQPKTTVMKDQSKCNHLQYLPQRLGEAGYDLQFIYGGDVNFTNMLGFLHAGGIDKVVSMDDFSMSDRQQEWGVPDHLMYDYLLHQLESAPQSQPYCKIMLTLSSHEPFDVPGFHRLDHPFANSYAYADSCLGHFVDELKVRPEIWDNLLLVVLPDHCSNYPDLELTDAVRYHIPMVWLGGALRTDSLSDGQAASPRRIQRLGAQSDLSATLLGQLGVSHDDFNFSKDLLLPDAPQYAFFDFPDGFGLVADLPDSSSVNPQLSSRISTYTYIQDNQQDGVPLKGSHDPQGLLQRWGKAYLQHLFDDLSQR